jgi:hypothetical protein
MYKLSRGSAFGVASNQTGRDTVTAQAQSKLPTQLILEALGSLEHASSQERVSHSGSSEDAIGLSLDDIIAWVILRYPEVLRISNLKRVFGGAIGSAIRSGKMVRVGEDGLYALPRHDAGGDSELGQGQPSESDAESPDQPTMKKRVLRERKVKVDYVCLPDLSPPSNSSTASTSANSSRETPLPRTSEITHPKYFVSFLFLAPLLI